MCEFTEDHDLLAVLTRSQERPLATCREQAYYSSVECHQLVLKVCLGALPSFPHYRHTGTGLGRSMAREADRQTKRQRQKQRDTETERSVCVFVLECVRVCAHMRARE